jgi:biotin/methionine sulfoxide reductase
MPKILRNASHWGAFRADVADGRVVRVTPFEGDPEPSDLIHCWPEMLDAPTRVARPVARRGWLAGDGGAARGEDGFVEIGWDDALDRVAGELDRVRTEHGNAAIFGGSYGWSSAGRVHHARTLTHRFLNTIGGFTGQVTNYSYGAAMAFLPRILGSAEAIGATLTGWDTIADNADVFLAFGGIAAKNWELQSGGTGRHLYRTRMAELRRRPVRLVNISPRRDDLADDVPAEWLPIRPNTDAALIMALTTEIVAAGRHDRDFLARYCSGFDVYADYLLGAADGTRKDAAWAAPICGVTEATIRALAADLPGRRVMLSAAWSLQRARHGEQPYWALIALAAVLGQIGLPGGGFAFGYGSSNAMGSPRYGIPFQGLPTGDARGHLRIPVARVADLLLDPGGTVRFDGATLTYPATKLIYWAGGNPFHHHQDLNRLRAAFRVPETVVVHETHWTATARHADLVLPATTTLERNDIGGASRDPIVLAMHKLVDPVGEARNDMDIFADLAARLGVGDAFTEGRGEFDWIRLAWARIRDALGRRGIETPVFEAFWEEGYFEVPPPRTSYTMFADFRADPEAHRLGTPSGRIDLFSPTVAAWGEPDQPGHPVWNDPVEWLGGAAAARHPLHLITPQPPKRLHGQMEASAVSFSQKRDGYERVQIHPDDAGPRGIADGDLVRLFNDRGACHAVAHVTDAIRPGVVSLPTGATYDPDGRADRNGNPNVLTWDIGTSELGQGCAAQSCLIEIARLDGPPPPIRVYAPPAIEAGAAP